MDTTKDKPTKVQERHFAVERMDGEDGVIHLACVERAVPGTGEDAPVAVLCHGFTDRSGTPPLENVAMALLGRGWRVVQFDFNGHGESEGTFERMTVENEVLDVQAVLVHFAGRQIALVGHSQGGVVAALAAACATPGTVFALVFLAPAGVLRDDAQRGRIFDAVFDPSDPPESIPLMGGRFRLGRGYILSAQRLHPYAEVARFGGPMCVVQGTGDGIVPWSNAERFMAEHARAGNGERDLLRLLPGANHGFAGREDEAAEIIADFLSALATR